MGGRWTGWARWARRGALVFTLLLLAPLGVGGAWAASPPPEGIFENCNLDTQMATCVQRLQVMHGGGIQIVVIPTMQTSLVALETYANAAHALGMSVMWELSNPSWWTDPSTSTNSAGLFAAFASACGCDDNGPLLDYTIRWLGQLPGTYGYYAADDTMLAPGDQAGVAQYVAEIKRDDPAHTVMIGAGDEPQARTYERISDVIGTEIYPVTTSSLLPVSANEDTWASIGQWAADAQGLANGDGKQSAFILQAFTWGDNLADGEAIGACSAGETALACFARLLYPSPAAQLQLRNEVLSHAHPKLILWWSFPGTYGDVTGDTYSIYPTGATAAGQWSGLSAAIQAPFPSGHAGRPASAAKLTTRHAVRAEIATAVRRHRHRRRHHRRHRRRTHS